MCAISENLIYATNISGSYRIELKIPEIPTVSDEKKYIKPLMTPKKVYSIIVSSAKIFHWKCGLWRFRIPFDLQKCKTSHKHLGHAF